MKSTPCSRSHYSAVLPLANHFPVPPGPVISGPAPPPAPPPRTANLGEVGLAIPIPPAPGSQGGNAAALGDKTATSFSGSGGLLPRSGTEISLSQTELTGLGSSDNSLAGTAVAGMTAVAASCSVSRSTTAREAATRSFADTSDVSQSSKWFTSDGEQWEDMVTRLLFCTSFPLIVYMGENGLTTPMLRLRDDPRVVGPVDWYSCATKERCLDVRIDESSDCLRAENAGDGSGRSRFSRAAQRQRCGGGVLASRSPRGGGEDEADASGAVRNMVQKTECIATVTM